MLDVFTWPVGRAPDSDRSQGESAVWRAPLAPVVAYASAAAVGGALVAGAISGAADLVRVGFGLSATQCLLAGLPVVLLAVVCQARCRVAPLPERRAQVPSHWVGWHSKVKLAGAFGVLIGSGVTTYMKHATAWVIATALLVAPSFAAALLTGMVYGAARGVPLAVVWWKDRGTPHLLAVQNPSERRYRLAWERIGRCGAPLTRALPAMALATYCALIVAM